MRTDCIAQGTLVSGLWWPNWKESPGKRGLCTRVADPRCHTAETTQEWKQLHCNLKKMRIQCSVAASSFSQGNSFLRSRRKSACHQELCPVVSQATRFGNFPRYKVLLPWQQWRWGGWGLGLEDKRLKYGTQFHCQRVPGQVVPTIRFFCKEPKSKYFRLCES